MIHKNWSPMIKYLCPVLGDIHTVPHPAMGISLTVSYAGK